MSAHSQNERRGKLTTSLGGDTLSLLRMDGTETMSRAFEWRVEALSDQPQLDLNALLGTHATVEIQMAQGTRYFDGIVCEAVNGGIADGGVRYDLVLRPWMHLAGLRRNQRIFHNKTVVEIIEEVMGDYADLGSPHYEQALSGEYPKLEYTVQYGESDAAFMARLMERFGISWCYKHTSGNHSLVMVDLAASLPEVDGGSRPFWGVQGQKMHDEEHFWHWQGGARVSTNAVLLTEYNFKTPHATQEAQVLEDAGHARGDILSYDYPGDYLDQGEGMNVASRRQQMEAGQGPRHHAKGDIPVLGAGWCVSLTGDQVANATGKRYICLETTHRFRSQAYRTGDVGGDERAYQAEYTLMPDDTPLRPERVTPVPRIQGPQTAYVVGDGEIDCDEFGRILVCYHWDLDKAYSMRCRVSQNWAARGWGGMVVPRIGMEVIVEHLEGDPDKPIVTGCVYNAVNMPPAELPANKSRSVFKTKSHQGEGFNELSFEDQSGEEFIYMHAQKNLDVHVKNSSKRRVEFDDNVSIGNNSNLDVAANRLESIDGKMDVTVKGDWAEKTDASRGADVSGDYSIKTGGDLTIKAGGEIVLDASKVTLVSGGAAVVVQGGAVNVAPVLHVGSASPGAAAIPAIPAILEAAAGAGSPFVSHCPMEDSAS
ncbi:type VI secretion system Vgr family protein [Nereida sp. MMG025]|uniref:type VI secretion system Vgr family protein n=1 Tax=Nereida sp. MMG025 TaxID=2909981 RepID=UPI001F00BFE9|nr:type VI secretion system tip protein TssI/VgrG [Nereida sp. MMG025]MCF6445746.1 type VI secretion system tip protein VgrG [Nereida sp. MMG025]